MIKRIYFWVHDHPRHVNFMREIAKICRLTDVVEKRKRTFVVLRQSYGFLNESEKKMVNILTIKDQEPITQVAYVINALWMQWLEHLAKPKQFNYKLTENPYFDWKCCKERLLNGKNVSDLSKIDFEDYFKPLLKLHPHFTKLEINFDDIRDLLWEQLELNRLYVVMHVVLGKDTCKFSYTRQFLLTNNKLVLPGGMEIESASPTARLIVDELLHNWNANVRMLEFRQDHFPKRGSPQKSSFFLWLKTQFVTFVDANEDSPLHRWYYFEIDDDGNVVVDEEGNQVERSEKSTSLLGHAMKDLFVSMRFKNLHCIHKKNGKVIWRKDQAVEKFFTIDGVLVKRLSSYSMREIDFDATDFESDQILFDNDECHFKHDEEHLSICEKNRFQNPLDDTDSDENAGSNDEKAIYGSDGLENADLGDDAEAPPRKRKKTVVRKRRVAPNDEDDDDDDTLEEEEQEENTMEEESVDTDEIDDLGDDGDDI